MDESNIMVDCESQITSSFQSEEKEHLTSITSLHSEEEGYLTKTPSLRSEEEGCLTNISSLESEKKEFLKKISSSQSEEKGYVTRTAWKIVPFLIALLHLGDIGTNLGYAYVLYKYSGTDYEHIDLGNNFTLWAALITILQIIPGFVVNIIFE